MIVELCILLIVCSNTVGAYYIYKMMNQKLGDAKGSYDVLYDMLCSIMKKQIELEKTKK